MVITLQQLKSTWKAWKLVGFAKFDIHGIIVFSLTLGDHMHHLWEVFGNLKEHNLKVHLGKFQFFHTQV
jgi:hypothetical protein